MKMSREEATAFGEDAISKMTYEIITKYVEDADKYIFEVIKPYCEEVSKREISKRDLEQALLQYFHKEPCEEFISVPRKALKFRTTNFVGYNVEWLKKHWQMEMDIVCGVKPCDDAISREAALNTINAMRVACDTNDIADYYILLLEAFKQLLPVTPSRRKGHWIREVDFGNCVHYVCSECKNEGEKDYCPRCGAEMESEK